MIRSIVCAAVFGFCSSVAFAGTNGSCVFKMENDNTCIQANNYEAGEASEFKTVCEDKSEGLAGVWTADTDCTAEGRVAGFCDLSDAKPKEIFWFFYAPMTAEQAQQTCKDSEGVWVP